MNERIYMDYNATTPPADGMIARLAAAWATEWGNPSSVHEEGRRAQSRRERSRETVAAALGASPDEIVFTSGGSESDALALRGLVEAGLVGSLVIGQLEHPAVLATAQWLAQHRGLTVRLVPAQSDGTIAASSVEQALAGLDRPLVSVMLAQNEIGVISDVAAIATVAHRHGALVHTDAVAAFGKIPVSKQALGVDLLTVSAHKIGGPPGVGALALDPRLQVSGFCQGGKQERGRRPGTEPFPLIIGFALAVESLAARLAAAPQTAQRRDQLIAALRTEHPDLLIAGEAASRLPNTVAAVFRACQGTELVRACDAAGLSISAGAACHSAAGSPVMEALQVPLDYREGLIRISMAPTVTSEQVVRAATIICRVARAQRTHA